MTVYAGTSLEATRRVIEYVLAEFRDLKENLVDSEELARAKDHLKGSLLLSLESTTSRMSNLARQERYYGRSISMDEIADRIDGVTAEQVRDLAGEWLLQERIALTVLGDLQGWTISRDELSC